MGERMTVRLVGGGPWGFRLQGGSGLPLLVSKVRRKSRAQHHLVEGDRILSINGVPCDNFSYDQAMGVVDAADNSLKIEIIRGGASGKENRDPIAHAYQPKEVAVKDKVTPQATSVHSKPKEPVAKPPEIHESRGLGPQVSKPPESTTIQPAPAPAAKAPPPPPPPKPFVPPASTIVAPPPWEPAPFIPQTTSAPSEITSSVRQVTSSISETRSVLQETKTFAASSELQTQAPKIPEPAIKPPEVPTAPSALPEVPTAPFALPEVPTAPSAFPEPPLPTFTASPKSLEEIAIASCAEVTSSEPSVAPKPPVQMPEAPPSVKELVEKIQGLAPELEALAPELAALETELAAFSSGPSGAQPGDVQRRQEVSVETTSEGQRYHSLTSEKTAWSAGPQHKASAFQQVEETRQVSTTGQDTSRRVETVKAESKKEIIRTSQTEVSAQNQLSPESKTDALSWRPTSPIFSQPILPPGDAGVRTPSPAPAYQVKKAPVKEAPSPAVWTPPSATGSVSQHQQEQHRQQEHKKKKKAPPTLPKPIRKGQQKAEPRPTSAPPRDYDIWDPFSDSELVYKDSTTRSKTSGYSAVTSISSGAVSDCEDWHHAYTSEDEMGSSTLFTRRKKMFSSSSFYEEPHSIYPTVEEQVELARKIAGSLSNDNNRKSKGANMFFKRVKRSHTWIHEGPDPYSDGGTTDTDMEPTTPDPASAPYIKDCALPQVSTGPPKLKLILDPRQLQDLVKLRNSGLNPVEHTAVSPDICLDLVRDLNSPRGKGAALFAKRKQKAEEWVVDEERVKQQLAQKEAEVAQLQEQELMPGFKPGAVVQNRLKMIKSPWEAALESPIGSCDAAFVELPPVVSSVATSIIRAAENKARIFPVAPAYSEPPFALQPDVYKPKAPRGWMGPATVSVPSGERNPSPMPLSREAPAAPLGLPRASSGAPRPYSFHDFNTTARSWTSSPGQSPFAFRHVNAPAKFK